jgi:signal transduction histidine kinase
VAWDEGGHELPAESMSALTTFALQAGLALLAGRAQRDRARMALFDDRDRIARDMHDHVIQRLFATGLSLQSAARAATHPIVRARLEEAVDDIDAAIKEIRQVIFELHQRIVNRTPQEELDALVASFAQALGFPPELAVDGPLADLNPSLRSDVLAVVGEGLSNVARHAHASRAQVTLVVDDAAVTVEVCDNGISVDRHQARSGLVNLGEGAAASLGQFDVQRANQTGTRLRWQVPRSSD